MKIFQVSELLSNPIFGEYIYVVGYCYLIQDSRLTNAADKKTKMVANIIMADQDFNNLDELKNMPTISFLGNNNFIENIFNKVCLK